MSTFRITAPSEDVAEILDALKPFKHVKWPESITANTNFLVSATNTSSGDIKKLIPPTANVWPLSSNDVPRDPNIPPHVWTWINDRIREGIY
jgi:hypothetical protein